SLCPLARVAPIRAQPGADPAHTVQSLLARLRDVLRPCVPDDVTIETMFRTDLDVDGILKGAAHIGADLVAVGTHGPRLLERLFIGSVASSVVHGSPQTVLAAPPPPPTEALQMWLRISGTATSTQPREWTQALDEFPPRNKGRRVAIQVDDPQIGAQMLGRGALVGVTYDAHDRRVEIMVGDAHRARRHLMHSIPNGESLAMTTDEHSASEALELRHGHGQTLVLVGP